MSARNDSAETAARMLDHLEQSGRHRLVRQAVTVVSMPPSRKDIDLPAIQRHFAARTRAVLLAPYERPIDPGEPIRYGLLSSARREAWLRVGAAGQRRPGRAGGGEPRRHGSLIAGGHSIERGGRGIIRGQEGGRRFG